MADKRAEYPPWLVGPDTIDDDEVIPGTGIDHGGDADGAQRQDHAARQQPSEYDQSRQQREPQEQGKKHSVGHGLVSVDGLMHVAVQAFRGYQQGVLGMIPAAILSAAVAAIAGWPSPFDA